MQRKTLVRVEVPAAARLRVDRVAAEVGAVEDHVAAGPKNEFLVAAYRAAFDNHGLAFFRCQRKREHRG